MDSMQKCILKCTIDANKFFVGSLSWQTSEESLHYHFEQYGPVMLGEGMRDWNMRAFCGFTFVVFMDILKRLIYSVRYLMPTKNLWAAC
jgi:RNA recognition motif-containing protein